MLPNELRFEINKVIDKLPDEMLPKLLKYVNDLHFDSPDGKRMRDLIDKIIEEEATFFKRLVEYDKNKTS